MLMIWGERAEERCLEIEVDDGKMARGTYVA